MDGSNFKKLKEKFIYRTATFRRDGWVLFVWFSQRSEWREGVGEGVTINIKK